jgi:hypothetical protein
MMTKKIYASQAGLRLGIGGLLLLLLACSEQPNQPFEKSRSRVNEGGNETIKGKPQSVAQNDKATAELIMALKESKMVLKESEILLRDAPRGKDSDASLMALERELQAAESLLIDVRNLIEQGDYLKAKAQIHEITDRTNHVNQQIKLAIRKHERGS